LTEPIGRRHGRKPWAQAMGTKPRRRTLNLNEGGVPRMTRLTDPSAMSMIAQGITSSTLYTGVPLTLNKSEIYLPCTFTAKRGSKETEKVVQAGNVFKNLIKTHFLRTI